MFSLYRRDFLKGLFATTALGFIDCRKLFAAEDGIPKVCFGVVSDVHIRNDAKTTDMWEKTLTWYGSQGVDAVLVAGDIADTSQLEQLKRFAATWYKVFPNDKRPDGGHVEKVFICGNHDYEGWKYPRNVDETQRKALFESSVAKDFKAAWDICFHEEFLPIYRKMVKGYSFIGGHWGHHQKIGEFMEAHKAEIDPALPFFYIQHPHPRDTVYGPWAWGHDNGASTKTFTQFPNAVVFTGHSHYPLTDESGIWQGGFTSVGTASLRYIGNRYGRENNSKSSNPALQTVLVGSNDSHGMLVKVYDDHITISRRSFAYDEALGADWILPLPQVKGKQPYEKQLRIQQAKNNLPAFAADAASKIVLTEKSVKNGGKELVPVVAIDFPAADRGGMVLDYEIKAEIGQDQHEEHPVSGKTVNDVVPHKWTTRVFAQKYFMPPSKRDKTMHYFLAKSGLPSNATVHFAITPLDCFGNRGQAIYSQGIRLVTPEPVQPEQKPEQK